MKKILGIVFLGLLFISIDLINPISIATAADYLEAFRNAEKNKMKKMGFFERQKYKYNKYNRKKVYCSERAESATTDYAAKKTYKACMSN